MNKKISITLLLIAVIAVSSIGLSGANASMMGQSRMNPSANSNALTDRSFIQINGVISQWGTTAVNGTIQTQAATSTHTSSGTNLLATATAMWTTNTSRPIWGVQTKQNFTNTFYEARLTNASVSTVSAISPSTNYFLNGTWNVYTTVSNVTIITTANGTITSVHRTLDTSVQKAYGALNVTANWTKFTLAINGTNPLTGSVFRYAQRQVQFNPFKVTEDYSNTVTKADIAAVIHSYGAMPGWGQYDARLDFCRHYKIDIANLATVAANY
jgi:hypothetical protein